MTNGNGIAFTSNIATEDYEPYFEDGHRLGDVHWIRQEFDGEQPKLLAGIMRASADQLPEAFDYTWSLDETIQVVEGSVRIEIDGGPTVTLGPGDIGSFKKGNRAVFKATGPYKQFFIMHG